MVLGNEGEHIQQVLKIFTKIYKKKSGSDELNTKIREVMNGFTTNPAIMDKIKAINFNDKEKNDIDKLFVA